jgi:hypothetical protein
VTVKNVNKFRETSLLPSIEGTGVMDLYSSYSKLECQLDCKLAKEFLCPSSVSAGNLCS